MRNKKGVALIWVLILSTVLLITATTMVNYIVKESRFSVRIEESTRVYAAAKSGIDWGKWKLDQPGNASGTYTFDFIKDSRDSNFKETAVIIDEPNNLITSTSEHNGVTRKLKYSIAEKVGEMLNLDEPLAGNPLHRWMGHNTESFEMQFDFWGNGAPFSVGVYDGNANKIYYQVDIDGNSRIRAYNTKDIISANLPLKVNLSGRNDYATYRAKIRYIKDTAAKVTVEKIDWTNPNLPAQCVGSAVIDLTGYNFGDLARLYIISTTNPAYITNGTLSDRRYISINNQVFIDNIFASFISDLPTHTILATATTGGAVSGGGQYTEGSDVSLVASADTSSGYLFEKWSGTTCPVKDSTIPAVSFTAQGDVTCSAIFQRATIVTVKTNGAGGSATGSNTYWPGGNVTLTATANSGYAFGNWSGCSTSTASPLTYTVPAGDVTCTANFYAITPIHYFIPNGYEYFYSTNSGETTDYKGVAWNSPSAQFAGAVVVNRYIHTTTGRHMYLLGTESLGLPWKLEGPVWYAFQPSAANRKNICRYRHPTVGDAHLWSTYCSGGPDYAGYVWEGPTFSVPY